MTLVKDPRGADPGGAPAYHLPPGTPPALPVTRPTGGGGGGGGGGFGPPAPYWQAGPSKALQPADVVGTWIASFGLGMNRQIFTFLLVGDRLRGVVCGRCDNPYTIGAMENIIIVGDTLYFDIVHQSWGENTSHLRSQYRSPDRAERDDRRHSREEPRDRSCPIHPARPAGRGFTLVGPIAPRGDEREQLRGRRRFGDQGPAPPSSRRPAGRRSGR